MTTCAEIQPLLPGYELGATEGPERDACDAHLASCATCLAAFLKAKRVREDAAAFDERPSPAVRDRLRARVAKRSKRGPVLWAVAAAALLAVALALRIFAAPPPPQEQEQQQGQPPAVLIDSAPLTNDFL